MFFSGSFFALATPSSMEDHMSFFASELLGLSCSLVDETCVYDEVLFVEAIVAAAFRFRGLAEFGGSQVGV
jgi:hypothetical protein